MSEEVIALPLEAAPIPVKPITEKQAPSDVASLTSYVLAGTEQPFQLLPQDRKRHRAIIIINGAANQTVILGRQNQVSNNRGMILQPGNVFEYQSASAVWAIPQAVNGVVTINVLDERYLDE